MNYQKYNRHGSWLVASYTGAKATQPEYSSFDSEKEARGEYERLIDDQEYSVTLARVIESTDYGLIPNDAFLESAMQVIFPQCKFDENRTPSILLEELLNCGLPRDVEVFEGFEFLTARELGQLVRKLANSNKRLFCGIQAKSI